MVRQTALEGLAGLAGKAAAERGPIVTALVNATRDQNARLAKRARDVLVEVYKATPEEMKVK